MQNATPMFRQYLEIKKQYPGTLLFFRLGDFYELFNEDAKIGSRELDITLTARHKDSPNPIPMCGVPHHAAAGYISKLVKKGYRVAVCEQTEEAGQGKKLVRREVARVITPGTAIDEQLLEKKNPVFLASVCGSGESFGAAYLEVSTGEFFATQIEDKDAWTKICSDLESYSPKEILFPESLQKLVSDSFENLSPQINLNSGNVSFVNFNNSAKFSAALTALDDWLFEPDDCENLLKKQFNVRELTGFGIDCKTEALRAAGACLRYAQDTQKATAEHISEINFVEANDFMVLDSVTLQNLEITESRGEIGYANSFIRWFAEEGKRIYGDIIPTTNKDLRYVVLKQPIGVCAAITPWNFPAAMITRKVAPALAAGCSIIVKPATETPLTALALGELAIRAGLPAGLLQIVTGKSSVIGEVLTQDERIHKLSFTGSTEVGRVLMSQCASTVKKLSMELGGNAPFIVFDDADLEKASTGLIASKYRNAGQTCVCANRVYVQSSIKDKFLAIFKQKVEALKVGNGMTEGVNIGPLINQGALDKVEQLLADAVNKGATVVTGGKKHNASDLSFEPTIITGITDDMDIASQEIFGPVAPVFIFDTDDEVIAHANNTIYGLAAYFYTQSRARSWKVCEGLEYGMVAQNTGLLSTEVAPFGGVKQSGFGREGSKYGIEDYVTTKYWCIDVQ